MATTIDSSEPRKLSPEACYLLWHAALRPRILARRFGDETDWAALRALQSARGDDNKEPLARLAFAAWGEAHAALHEAADRLARQM